MPCDSQASSAPKAIVPDITAIASKALLELVPKPPIKPKPNTPETRAVVADVIAHKNIGTLNS